MNFHLLLVLITISFLKKRLQTKTELPEWDRRFRVGLQVTGVLFALSFIFPKNKEVFNWIGQFLCFGLVYLILYQPEFKPAKQTALYILPLLIVSLLKDVLKLISDDFFEKVKGYFDTAIFFAVIWMAAQFIIGNRQTKALEKERQRTRDKEKEFEMSEKIKFQLEKQVLERTASLTLQKEELEKTIAELKSTQDQLIQSEKMASLGELTAGIAHEIQNPLNFVNNFSELNTELIDELQKEISAGNIEDVKAIANDIKENEQKINHHGKRADSIVKGMLQHSRVSSGQKEQTDLNALADEYLRLAYHGLRAKDKTFNANLVTDYDSSIGIIHIIPQDIGRVILNLITNAFYVVNEKKKQIQNGYDPTVTVKTKKTGKNIIISVADNGNGIPQKIMDKIFQPFFTTKPTGQGTGLGLSLSYDIVKAHGGELKVETKEGVGSTFSIELPA